MNPDQVRDGYRDFIRMKWERGSHSALIERLDQKSRLEIYEIVLAKLLAGDPKQDKEFMDRVGTQLLKRQERMEKNATFEKQRF